MNRSLSVQRDRPMRPELGVASAHSSCCRCCQIRPFISAPLPDGLKIVDEDPRWVRCGCHRDECNEVHQQGAQGKEESSRTSMSRFCGASMPFIMHDSRLVKVYFRKYEQVAKRGGPASVEWLRMPGTTPPPAPEMRWEQLPRSSRQCDRHAKPGRTQPGNLCVALADCRWILKLLDHLEVGRPLSARELTDLVLLMSRVIISSSVVEEKYQDGWMNSST